MPKKLVNFLEILTVNSLFSSQIKDFFGRMDFLFVMKESGEKCSFHVAMPKPKDIKGNKAIIIVKAREEQETDEPGFPTGIDKEVVFMELAKPVLDNLYTVGQVSGKTVKQPKAND